MIITKLLSY